MSKRTLNFKLNSFLMAASLSSLVVACGGGGGSISPASTPTPTSSPAPSPTPTPAPSPTPSPTPTPAPPTFCQLNVANFSSLVGIDLGTEPFDPIWGPALVALPFPVNLNQCQSSLTWQQERVMAATSYWVSQKVNYCHHHVPTWYPTEDLNGNPNPQVAASFESCSANSDIMPPVPAESMIRWNYSGAGRESAQAWYESNNSLAYATGNYGYGLDCSDYSKLVYDYAESIMFNSGIKQQAGQSAAESNLAPNMIGFNDDNADSPAGSLVCADGTLAPKSGAINTSCAGHGAYISVFESDGTYNSAGVTDGMLNNLQPGDLLYIAGCGSDPTASSDAVCAHNPRQDVTHVIIWTGEKIGSSLWIIESMIAPETDKDVYGSANQECGTVGNPNWWSVANNIGNWIISDSHYQGPDYRAFTSCFYRNQVWGVRRVLGVN